MSLWIRMPMPQVWHIYDASVESTEWPTMCGLVFDPDDVIACPTDESMEHHRSIASDVCEPCLIERHERQVANL
jgi:hypothetical protein